MDIKTKKKYWLIGRMAPTTLENKILIYKTIIRPIWTYGIELWGCSNQMWIPYYSVISIKIPRNNHKCPMVYIKQITPWRSTNRICIRNLQQKSIKTLSKTGTQSVNSLCLYPEARRLKRKWPQDLQDT